MVVHGIMCPYLQQIVDAGDRFMLICGCNGGVLRTQVEAGGMALYLACNCQRTGNHMCHARYVWDTCCINIPVRKEAPVEPPFPAVPGRVCPRPRQGSAVLGAPQSSGEG